MKKLLVGLSAIVMLVLSGCATSSAPTPNVSSHEETHTKLPKDAAKLKNACDLKDSNACSKLSAMYLAGKGVEKNPTKALKYSKKACTLNNNKSCVMTGLFYENGWSRKKNYSQAAKYYRKACKLNEGFGCFLLAFLYDGGRGVKQDYHQATKYYRKSCDLKDKNGCKAYKNMKKAGY